MLFAQRASQLGGETSGFPFRRSPAASYLPFRCVSDRSELTPLVSRAEAALLSLVWFFPTTLLPRPVSISAARDPWHRNCLFHKI